MSHKSRELQLALLMMGPLQLDPVDAKQHTQVAAVVYVAFAYIRCNAKIFSPIGQVADNTDIPTM